MFCCSCGLSYTKEIPVRAHMHARIQTDTCTLKHTHTHTHMHPPPVALLGATSSCYHGNDEIAVHHHDGVMAQLKARGHRSNGLQYFWVCQWINATVLERRSSIWEQLEGTCHFHARDTTTKKKNLYFPIIYYLYTQSHLTSALNPSEVVNTRWALSKLSTH